jgi:hypothetical protein
MEDMHNSQKLSVECKTRMVDNFLGTHGKTHPPRGKTGLRNQPAKAKSVSAKNKHVVE